MFDSITTKYTELKNTIQCKIFFFVTIALVLLYTTGTHALTFSLPSQETNIVGEVHTVFIEPGESLQTVARRNDMGYEELVRANQHINPYKPRAWSKVIIPSSFILPDTKREGIIINLPELRLYYYPKDSGIVMTFPIGVGRQGWLTPTATTKVIEKKVDPEWFVPESIQDHMAEKGVFLPDIVEAGPNNPLGEYAMKLRLPGYLIHGTNRPNSVGKRSSSGCIRMLPEDVEQLFQVVSVGEKVQIINQPYKAGWHRGDLYLESHKPFWDQMPNKRKYDSLRSVVSNANVNRNITVDWGSARMIHDNFTGYPQLITRGY